MTARRRDDRGDLSVEAVSGRERRKVRAREVGKDTVWFGLGMFGLVGWAVALPTLAGLGLGLWIDARYPSDVSWTLALLLAGVALGCLNAWYWVERQRREIERGRESEEEEP